MKYSVDGRSVRESTKTRSKEVAKRILTERLAAGQKGEIANPHNRRLKMSDLFELVMSDYKINHRKSIEDLESRWRLHLGPWFGHMLVTAVTSDSIQLYVTRRIREGAANSTINRELSVLVRMYSLAAEANPPKVRASPKISRLTEDNVRTGFLSDEEHERLFACCQKRGTWLLAMLQIGYTFGWRISEVRGLRVGHIDLRDRRIHLNPNTTKNKDGRLVKYAPGSLLESLLDESCKGKSPSDYVFTRPNGKPVRRIEGVWRTVCWEAGLATRVCKECESEVDGSMYCATCGTRRRVHDTFTRGLLFHDLRRTAARNARSSGVAESVIMKLGGWKTRAMFDRYAIINEGDMELAINLIEERQERARRATSVQEVLESKTDNSSVEV